MSKGNAVVAATATELRAEIIRLKKNVAQSSLELGRLFKEIKDGELFRQLDYDTFNEFLGDPEIGMGRSTAYLFMELYERWVLRLQVESDRLSAIGTKKLQLINPVMSRVETNPKAVSTWLDKAEYLSCSDLKIEVDEALGRPETPQKSHEDARRDTNSTPAGQGAGDNYVAYVEAHNCIFHPTRPADKHHFPRTRGAGAEDWKVIPLCRECHTEYHHNPKEWTWTHRIKLLDFYYNLIYTLYEARSISNDESTKRSQQN